VLAKINASGAGVSATFDTLTERVVLTDEEPGASGAITLGADDSGFLDAVKLSAAALTPGTDEDMIRALDQVSEIAVQSGTFKINGVILSVDTQSDSLHDLIERINAADTGVTASFDLESGRVKLSSSTYFDLEDGTSGLFGSLGIEEGRYGEELVSAGLKKLRFSNSRSLRRDLRKVSNAVQDLLASPALSGKSLESELVRNALGGALRSAIGELKPDAAGDHLSTGLGIAFDFRANGEAKVSIDQGQLSHALNKRASDLAQFLMGSSGPGVGEGLIALLSKAVESIEEIVFPLFDPGGEGGLFVDYLA
jgi:flagellar capping protein FliD